MSKTSYTEMALSGKFKPNGEDLEYLQDLIAEIRKNPAEALKGAEEVLEELQEELLKKGLCPECAEEYQEKLRYAATSEEPPEYEKFCSCGWKQK